MQRKLEGKADVDFTVSVNYAMNILPVDEQADLQQDLLLFANGLMPRKRLVEKWALQEDWEELLNAPEPEGEPDA
jgi:hypothetical protein